MTYVRAEHRHLEPVVPEEGIILPTDHISVPHFRCALGIAQNDQKPCAVMTSRVTECARRMRTFPPHNRRLSLDGDIAQGCPLYYTLAK